jgi:hypothetical protein
VVHKGLWERFFTEDFGFPLLLSFPTAPSQYYYRQKDKRASLGTFQQRCTFSCTGEKYFAIVPCCQVAPSTGVSEEPYCLHFSSRPHGVTTFCCRLLVRVSLLPLPGTQFRLQQIAGRTVQCAAVLLSPTHSLTHTHALAFLPSPTTPRYTG